MSSDTLCARDHVPDSVYWFRLCVAMLYASATQIDAAFSNASMKSDTVAEDVRPASTVGVADVVGSPLHANTSLKPASSAESVPYSVPPKMARQRAS